MKKISGYLSCLLLLIYIIMFRIVIVEKYVAYYDLINVLFFGIITFLVYMFYGYRRKTSLVNYTVWQNLIIALIVYYIFIYVLGLFLGFLRNPYLMNYGLIFRQVISLILLLGCREFLRYMIISQTNKKNWLLIGLITLTITLFDIVMEISGYDLSTNSGIFEFIESCVMPKVALNSLLTFFAYNFNYKIVLCYALLMTIPIYILPIYPDLGDYFGSIIKVIFIFYCYYNTSVVMEKYERKVGIRRKKRSTFRIIIIILPLFLFVGIISGLFKYHLFAVGSNSMVPYFAKGDTVMIEKISNDDIENIKVGDVLAFYTGNVLVVHRVKEISLVNGIYEFRTKGDNNSEIDNFKVYSDDIYGKVIFVVKYLGVPSIELRELLSE